jgi:signal transduction histidine kinase
MSRSTPSDDDEANRSSAAEDREISEFLLRACHDLRTPLRAVNAHAELLLKQSQRADGAGMTEQLGFIAGGAKQMDLLVDGMTNYAIALQMDAGAFMPMPSGVMVRTALAKLTNEVRDNQAEITYGELPRITCHADLLTLVFEHLIRNSLRHRGAASPRIHITAERSGDGASGAVWRFAVSDNGPGIPPGYLESIFKPFAKVGAKRAGAGLGLATCRVIVEKHGGNIRAESEEGKGATFLMTLPAE